jgi:hypothetical protein
MILLDANVLLYAYDSTSPFQRQLSDWLEAQFESDERIGLPWVTIWAFVRVRTSIKGLERPATVEESLTIIRDLLQQPGVATLEPGPRHIAILERLCHSSGVRGANVTDAVIAALAMEYGAAVASTDHDFSRFEGLRWVNPLKVA